MLIAVSGNIGSGKTTLARFIANNYGFSYVPTKRLEFNFLEDFFMDIEGKFFPAQVSFLISKAIEIQSLHADGKNIVIDRSLLEDIQVFARLWSDRKAIDRKIVQLYQYTAEFISSAIPTPDMYIVCRCPAQVCAERIASRPARRFEALYPPNHVQVLGEYYSKLTFEWGVPYVEVDTTYYDFTNSSVLESICKYIFEQFTGRREYGQLSLFDDTGYCDREIEIDRKGLVFHYLEDSDYLSPLKPLGRTAKYIYLAAPFTQLANDKRTVKSAFGMENDSFFEENEESPYGGLPISYRKKLVRIETAIRKQCGYRVLLPHRDINKWGMVTYPTQHITPQIVETVEHAAAIVAIPGSSIGVHMEVGIAIARRIPVIIIETKEFQNSFFLEGMKEIPGIKYMKVESLSQIPKHIEQENIMEFISGFGGEK